MRHRLRQKTPQRAILDHCGHLSESQGQLLFHSLDNVQDLTQALDDLVAEVKASLLQFWLGLAGDSLKEKVEVG